MAKLSAISLYIHYWWSGIPTWVSALGFFIFINVINLLHVKLFGEMEFWLAIIKVLAIIAMIAFGSYLLATGNWQWWHTIESAKPLGIRRFLPEWRHGIGYGHGDDYVCFWWH